MKKKIRIVKFVTSIILLLAFALVSVIFFKFHPSNIVEMIDRMQLKLSSLPIREPKEFNFFVLGHLYGSPGEDDQMPAKSISKRLPELLALQPDFVVSLGDMVFHKTRPEFINLQAHFLSQIKVPFYNTPGNHDVNNSDILYREFIGRDPYPAKSIGSATLIFLDTEIRSCRLDENQEQNLQTELDAAVEDPQTYVIIVFMHKTLPFQDTEMRALNSRVAMPNEWKCQKKDGSNMLMDQYFIPTAKKKPVILFAGDVGAWGNLSPYYQRDPWLPLTLVMTGLGDTDQDNVIHVQVTPDAVRISAIFLDTMREVDLAQYNRAYWMKKATSQ